MKKKLVAVLLVCSVSTACVQARVGHFGGMYAGFSFGQQNVNTNYNLDNAQFGSILSSSSTSTDSMSGDTTTTTTTPVFVNGKGSFVQRGMTGSAALGWGFLLGQVYMGLEAEGAFGLGVNQPAIMIENVGTVYTTTTIVPGASSTTVATSDEVTGTQYFDLTTTLNWKPAMRLSGALRLGYLITPKVMVFLSAGMARTTFNLTRSNTLYTATSDVFGTGLGSSSSSYSGKGATQQTSATGTYANLAFTAVSTSAKSNAIIVGLGTEIAISQHFNLCLKGEYEVGQSVAKALNLKPSVLGLKFGLFYYF